MGIIINGQNDTIGPVDNTMSLLGTVSIGGTMTIEDFTNIDSVGLITARSGLDVTGGTVTITTGANSASPAGSGDNLVIKDSNGCGLSILSGNGNSQNIYLGSISDNDAVRLEGFYNSGSPYFNIYTGGSQRLRITSDGTLNLSNGTINLGTADSSSGHINAYELMTFNIDSDNDDSNRHFTWYKNGESGGGTGMMRLDENGRLVIGGDLATSGNNLTLKNSSAVEIDMNCTGGSGNNFRIKSDSNGNFTIRDHSAGFDKITILDGGYVGINKTAPAKHLHVGGAIAMDETNGLLFFAKDGEGVNTNTNNTHWIGRVDNAGYHATSGAGGFSSVAGSLAIGAKGPIMFATSANNDTYSTGRMIITADGKLGLGVAAPVQMVEITNTGGTGSQIQIRDTSTGTGSSDGLRVGYNGSGGQMWNFENTYIRFATNNSERVRIASDGKFGIGTDNPTNKLHVYSSSDTGEIRIGGGNGSGNHRIFIQAHPSTAYIDSYGNNTHSPLSINADPLILNQSGSGKVLVRTSTNNDNQADLVVGGMIYSGAMSVGRVADSTNNNNRTTLLHRMVSGQGFQFSGKFVVQSYTGNAYVDCHITVHYTSQNVEVDIVNATHSSQISKTNLRVVTADYGSNRYLGIQKNGGGTGVAYINAFVNGNIDSSGNGGIREVNNTSLGSVTTHGNLN